MVAGFAVNVVVVATGRGATVMIKGIAVELLKPLLPP
jgi:hypothetical protein